MREASSRRFAYRAAAADGRLERGIIDAPSAGDARRVIAARGWYAIALEERGRPLAHRGALPADELGLGLRVLADLLGAGLSVGRALHAFRELAPRGWQPALPALAQTVREGKSLATALANAPIDIPPLVVGIVLAGEAGSGLAAGMRRAADLTQSMAQTRAAVRSALAYPLVVAIAGAAAVTILITVVLPRFAAILADLDQRLPASTRAVIAAASFARAAVVPAIACAILVAAAFRLWTSSESGLRAWHSMLLATPLVGSIRRAAAVARMAHALAALVDSGVSLAAALPFAARATGDAELTARMSEARTLVLAGEPLSNALGRTGAATAPAIRLVRAGEESGRLASMLAHAARIEQERADRFIHTGVRMLEPVLLLVFASVVALIAAALLQAIYSVRPTP